MRESLELLANDFIKRTNESDYRDFTRHALLHRLLILYNDYKKLEPFWGHDLNVISLLSVLLADRTNCENEILRRMKQ